jgi:hypothetical protein
VPSGKVPKTFWSSFMWLLSVGSVGAVEQAASSSSVIRARASLEPIRVGGDERALVFIDIVHWMLSKTTE